MSKQGRMSTRTRMNWLMDAAVFLGGILAALSGIYFMFLPSGGYQGGRNPMYGIKILFDRQAWDNLHAWGGVLMIAAVVVHIAFHWQWVKMMARRMVNRLMSRGSEMSRGAKINVAINAMVGISFLLCALSGVYLLFAPAGGFQGGNNAGWDPGFLFSRTTWDLIHTWSGAIVILAAVAHLTIHWRWVKNVTVKFFVTLLPQPNADLAPVAGRKAPAGSR
jgi:hypothetical protein